MKKSGLFVKKISEGLMISFLKSHVLFFQAVLLVGNWSDGISQALSLKTIYVPLVKQLHMHYFESNAYHSILLRIYAVDFPVYK